MGVGDLVRWGVGGIDEGDAVHVREQIAHVGAEQLYIRSECYIDSKGHRMCAYREHMMGTFCAAFKERWHEVQVGGTVVIARPLGGCGGWEPGFCNDDDSDVSFRRFRERVVLMLAEGWREKRKAKVIIQVKVEWEYHGDREVDGVKNKKMITPNGNRTRAACYRHNGRQA
jgi:hypothetical protein